MENKVLTSDLFLAVVNEVTKLREHATVEELNQLSIEKLNPLYEDKCIYGLMTGSCWSNRATHLLKNCAVTYTTELFDQNYVINKSERTKIFDRDKYEDINFYSAIEFFIANVDQETNEALIKYLKTGYDAEFKNHCGF